MKNLLVITDRYPYDGVNTSVFVKNQVDAVKNQFDKVTVLALSPIVPRFLSSLHFIKPRWKRDSMVKDYSYDNVSVYFVKYFNLPLSFFKQRTGDVCFKKIRELIKEKYIDFSIIHAHFTYPSGYVAAKLKESVKKPLVITGHGYDVYKLPFKSGAWKEKVRYALESADLLTTPSRSNAEKMKDLGIPAEKIIVVPNGYESEVFRPIKDSRNRIGLPEDKKILLSVGNLEKVKGHINLVKAVGLLHDKYPELTCYIVGEGPEHKNLEEEINRLGLEDAVILKGAKPHNEIPIWMNACDIFVLPSLKESFGIVQIEAMACGKPVVATMNGGSEEIIIDKRVGLLVKAGDSEAMAGAIEKVLNTKWDSDYIAEFVKNYEWGNVADEMLVIYEDLLGGGVGWKKNE